MSTVKKSVTGGGAPSLDILAAKLKILEAEFRPEPYEVKMDSGRTFEADPNVNVKVERRETVRKGLRGTLRA